MLTKNGNVFFGQKTPTVSTSWILTNGNILASNNGVSPSSLNNTYYNEFGIIVGSSDIEPSVNDYCLKDEKSLTQISTSKTNSSSYTDDFMMNVQTVIKNNTNNNVVVKEVGLIARNYYGNILLIREVLQEPITIQPNKSYLFNMTI